MYCFRGFIPSSFQTDTPAAAAAASTDLKDDFLQIMDEQPVSEVEISEAIVPGMCGHGVMSVSSHGIVNNGSYISIYSVYA
jgi:hypothetical protein